MDGDARLGPVCELIVNGRYCWLPFAAIAEIRFQAPASVTDLVWRHALVRLTDGSEQVCQIPARYPVTPQAEARFQLGRATEWQPLDDEGALYQGHGQKVWLNDNDEFPILSRRGEFCMNKPVRDGDALRSGWQARSKQETIGARDKMQPSLLDRLTDNQPQKNRSRLTAT